MPVVVKRVYEPAKRADGARVLVDRLWPRGLSKGRAAVDAWLRDLSPSDELRRWFHATPGAWASFRKRYLKELSRREAASALSELYEMAHGRKRVTLLFASRNKEYNNATVLKDLLDGMRKPPTGTGPPGARVARQAHTRRAPRG